MTDSTEQEVTVLDTHLLVLFKQINDGIVLQMNRNLREWGITYSQMQTICVLHANGGRMFQKDLAARLNVTHPTIAGLIDRLEKGGFVETSQDDSDKRKNIVILTPRAEKHYRSLKRSRKKTEEALLAGLSPEDLDALNQYLQTIRANALSLNSADEQKTKHTA